MNTSEFIRLAREVHGEAYSYDANRGDTVNVMITAKCKRHGTFRRSVKSHLQGIGCAKCDEKTEEWKAKVAEKHNNAYSYEKVKRVSVMLDEVTVTCPDHGDFKVGAGKHLYGRKCPKCLYGGKAWETKARKVHGDRYDYSLVEYKGARKLVKIKCKIHGVFEQMSFNHLNGAGCPTCGLRSGKAAEEADPEIKDIREFNEFMRKWPRPNTKGV